MKTTLVLIIGIGLLLLEGCSPHPADIQGPAATPPIELPDGSITITLRQRSEIPIPGSFGRVRVRIGDITRGQVLTTIVYDPDGNNIAGPAFVSVRESLSFSIEGHAYHLELTDLSNALIGEDFASFVVSERRNNSMTEEEKIVFLINSIKDMKDSTFLRNGQEYDSVAAAEHLRRKWQMQTDQIQTAEEFIQRVATASSVSGEPYRIRLPAGREVESASYLREQLKEMEGAANNRRSAHATPKG